MIVLKIKLSFFVVIIISSASVILAREESATANKFRKQRTTGVCYIYKHGATGLRGTHRKRINAAPHSSRIRCDAMQRFNCVRACRGVMRTTCVKQGDGTYLCVCFNGDLYGNHDRADGQVIFLSNVFGRTTKAPFPYYLEPLHLQHGRRGGVSDPCDPRSRFRHIFNYEERIAHEKNNDVSDRVFV